MVTPRRYVCAYENCGAELDRPYSSCPACGYPEVTPVRITDAELRHDEGRCTPW